MDSLVLPRDAVAVSATRHAILLAARQPRNPVAATIHSLRPVQPGGHCQRRDYRESKCKLWNLSECKLPQPSHRRVEARKLAVIGIFSRSAPKQFVAVAYVMHPRPSFCCSPSLREQ
ncbi:hypothetical protein FOWG_17237 [Fusarium oxysporum f. sp. lycopersici MN25]|nr:hypothetical protein FOWG_17237 [Fusarium oxysporum f. sp. lycopersici MN25]